MNLLAEVVICCLSHSMQVQNTAMLQQFRERDAEINRLQKELAVWTVGYETIAESQYCDAYYVQEQTVCALNCRLCGVKLITGTLCWCKQITDNNIM